MKCLFCLLDQVIINFKSLCKHSQIHIQKFNQEK